ncbi:MAG: Gx transporter family protein [Lachnospiraceae bacterium]|nr:Gx transporter family protein [Lachnospiraceae bacterium]MDD7327683.1 Gx transporter family protein [Lachnospiraceae bacterium]MDY2759576.1 Gx transporter family protein [Lachnospiraceae bacterium]
MKNQSMKRSSRIASLGVFLALAMILSYVETLIPINFGVPGMKLGLANMVTVILMYIFSPAQAFIISMLRILLSGLLFGNAMSLIYSYAGGVLSFVIMYLCFRTRKVKMIPLSVIGAVSHNAGQLIAAAILVTNYNIVFYLPVLIIAGIITGLITGSVSAAVHSRLIRLNGFS